MARGRKPGSMVELATRLEKSKSRIADLRQELQRESDAAAGYLVELQRQVHGMNRTDLGSAGGAGGGAGGSVVRSAVRGAVAGSTARRGRRGSGQRESLVAFIKGKGQPQNPDAIAAHLGKSGKMSSVRQTLMQMCKAGTLTSFKQDNGSYRAPKKGERGGYYGVK